MRESWRRSLETLGFDLSEHLVPGLLGKGNSRASATNPRQQPESTSSLYAFITELWLALPKGGPASDSNKQ
eukprot:5854688-Prorocentrum_lima.AAC.1